MSIRAIRLDINAEPPGVHAAVRARADALYTNKPHFVVLL